MANKIHLVLLFLFLFLSRFVTHSHGKKQTEALDLLYKAKLNKNSGINTGDFEAIPNVDGNKVLPQGGLKEKDRIERLPGQPKAGFAQYGGYVTIDESAGRAFYYYFVEAHHSKQSLPLLLWLNGGPGCSSLAYGAMQELGPFRVHSDGKTLYKNNFAWNNAANVLFLESPAGVGFSYSNTTSDFEKGGDKKTAADNYVFLLNWLERFPEYKNRDFYISGESYAGHYVPQLAHNILYYNKKAKKTIINLKGIIIGNAVINDETDSRGMYDFFASHALISDETSHQIMKYCDFLPNATTQTSRCNAAANEANKDVNDIDIYNIYAPLCLSSNLTAKPKKTSLFNFDPCSDYYVFAYLNRPDVQEALHANVTKLHYDWQSCTVVIQYWEDSPSTVIPLLREFMANGVRVWIFSGDIDGRVPVTSTQYSINKMKLPVKTSWHPWLHKGEVGGYTQVYEGGLTFATVRGAGHQQHFQAEDTDILLCSGPKSGTTWLKAILFAVMNRGRYASGESPLLTSGPHDLIPFMEFDLYMHNESPDLEHLPPPRIFSTHLPYASLASSIEESNCKIVYICRNPLDQLISHWHFVSKLRRANVDPLPFEQVFEYFCSGKHNFGPFWDHVLGYWKASLENPNKVLFLKYEDLKEDITFHLKRLAEFLGCPFSMEEENQGFIDEISKLCSFENLKNLDINKTGRRLDMIPNSMYFRKGEVGDWANYLTASMAERLEKLMEEKFSGSGLTFKLSCKPSP
ncbi:hypothetical protein F0562_018765 [Nyssa sinensis]|uniref:Carboxypeptidase n=1 Tax=Nyssa sinensis TaxID=561372 RepID=A0A5J4ZCW9_9ASTE|nr:hypothetical protein F0562_018765 [Nyssa sinensis]